MSTLRCQHSTLPPVGATGHNDQNVHVHSTTEVRMHDQDNQRCCPQSSEMVVASVFAIEEAPSSGWQPTCNIKDKMGSENRRCDAC
eukprot:5457270-Pleurochrysis_carterae.AAC.1